LKSFYFKKERRRNIYKEKGKNNVPKTSKHPCKNSIYSTPCFETLKDFKKEKECCWSIFNCVNKQ